jgi:hemolysin III
VLLILLADAPAAYVGAVIFATTLILLYLSSASYHLAPWPPRLRSIMMRLDHSMIFVLIAGTYTPFCLVAVGRAWGIPMLAVVWSLAAAGVCLKTLWPHGPRWLGVGLYLSLGWLAVVAAGPLGSELGTGPALVLLLGGVLYSLGAVAYAARRPDPIPRWFGYHEVFHALVVSGSVAHFALVAHVVHN